MMDHGAMDHGCTLTDSHELALAIIPIPSAILSIIGSSTIIFMAYYQNRTKRKCSPYTRLLVAMSVCDIILSINLSVATFARPKETSPRLFSFGNSATCSTVGFLNQMFFANIWYQTMLSIYFLLTTRFGFSNKYIGKKIEPWMHFLSIGYSLVAAVVTLGMGAYSESSTMLGCWLGNPKDCSEGVDAKVCPSVLMGYFWLSIPMIFAFITVFVNNLAILAFMRRQMPQIDNNSTSKSGRIADIEGSHRSLWNSTNIETPSEAERSQHDDPELLSSSAEEEEEEEPSQEQSAQKLSQKRRLKLVTSQAFLFVASFFLCNVWTTAGAKFESIMTEAAELKVHDKFFPVLVCQAFFAPLQGFLNMMVYIRPRYLALRQDHPDKPRRWIIHRAIFGEKKKPVPPEGEQKEIESNKLQDLKLPVGQERTQRLPYGDMVSSLTTGDSDYDHNVIMSRPSTQQNDRWIESSADKTQIPVVSTRFHSETGLSQLEVISEYEEATFASHCSPLARKKDPICRQSLLVSAPDERWSSNKTTSGSSILPLPQRVDSELESTMSLPSMGTKVEQSDETVSSKDVPIRIPKRRLSPTPSSTEEFVHDT